MKKLNYILAVLCLALYSCGMTDVWKDWENEGIMSEDRLLPSDVKEVLLAQGGLWKMTYEDTDFYYQFEEGTVVTLSDETILEDEVESNWYLDYDGEDVVLLHIDEGGALKYLSEGVEETFRITAFGSDKITATGQNYGEEMILTPTTSTAIAANKEARRLATIAKNKALFMERIKSDLSNGLLRDSDGRFIAHYAVNKATGESIVFSVIEDGVLRHETCVMNIEADDEKTILNFVSLNPVKGYTVSKFYYYFESGKMTSDNADLKVDTDAGAAVRYYTGSGFKTHKVSKNWHGGRGAACEEMWNYICWFNNEQMEVNDRSQRPFILILYHDDWAWGGYGFFDPVYYVDSVDSDIIHYSNIGSFYMPYGGDSDFWTPEVEENFRPFLNICCQSEGWRMVREEIDGTSYLYFFSPTGDTWFRADRYPGD